MTHLHIKKEELSHIFPETSDLSTIIRHYELKYEKIGEVICQISMNQFLLTEEDELRLSGTPLSRIDNLEIRTENPNALFVEVTKYWISRLPLLIEFADQLSLKLRFEPLDESSLALTRLVDECNLLVNSLKSIDSICYQRHISLPQEWKKNELFFLKTFDELLNSLQAKEMARMADTIEYNLATALQDWEKTLRQISL